MSAQEVGGGPGPCGHPCSYAHAIIFYTLLNCLQLGYIHSSKKQLTCSGQQVYTSPLLVVSTARYIWLCTCTALSSKATAIVLEHIEHCMQDHDIGAPPLFAFFSAVGRCSTVL